MAWTSPRTWLAGEKPSAATLNAHIRDNFKAIGDPWASFTPTWTASTTNPTIGNGTLVGAYMQAGKLIRARIIVLFGSTTTVGSGTYAWALPATSYTFNIPIGSCLYRDASGPAVATRLAYAPSQTTVSLVNEAGTALTHSTIAWANGDTIAIDLNYEAA